METELHLMELKLKVKKWEMEFMKTNGQKPTNQDIPADPHAKAMYLKYASAKKLKANNSTPRKQADENIEPTKQKSSVWGSNLLKANCKHDIDDHLNQENEEKKQAEEKPKLPDISYRDNIRKNIGTSVIKSTPTSLKRSKVQFAKKEKPLVQTNDNHQIMGNVESDELSFTFNTVSESKVSVQQYKPTVAKKTPLRFSKMRNLASRSIDMNWLNERTDDLSDLVDLETKMKSEEKVNETQIDLVGNTLMKQNDIEQNLPMSTTEKHLQPEKEHFIEANDPFLSTDANKDDVNTDVEMKDNKDDLDKEPVNDSITSKAGEGLGRSNGGGGGRSDMNVNYQRLNMKQKTFCRKGGRGRFLRKQVFREKMAKKGFSGKSGWKGRSGGASYRGGGGGGGFRDKSEDKCFKCGESGHWASKCTGKGKLKTAENAMESTSKETFGDVLGTYHLDVTSGDVSRPIEHMNSQIVLSHAEPLYKDDEAYDDDEVLKVLKQFGFSEFRSGQKNAIKRILMGQPTLLVLSTGSGKSLCYQLPAYMYAMKRNALTLVVSPLVSLMDDQVRGLPKFLRASRLHSGMSKEQREKVMAEIQEGKVDILLLSPEALTAWAGMSPYYSPLSKLPPVSFVCVDECHCLSEWSHSFRPSYLRVCQVLISQLGIKCMVGLTATSTITTCLSVAKQLGIKDIKSGLIMNMKLPPNLCLTVSKDKYKDEALEQMLKGERFKDLDSIIIYCTRRDEVARVSSFLRTTLQVEQNNQPEEEEQNIEECVSETSKKRKRKAQPKSNKKRAVLIAADCYHAGMSASQRKAVQNKFMSGKLKIVVATVAFGMGIDKHDVRSVIHYNMPRSFERYVQEVGRAGRDRLPAQCHLFLSPEGEDLSELSRHSYGKTVDRYTVKHLVKNIFKFCKCAGLDKECHGHYSAVCIEEYVEDLDVTKEGIETILCYMELEGLIDVFLPTETKCFVHCYSGPSQLIKVIKKCPAVAIALKEKDQIETQCHEVEFSLIKVANKLGMAMAELKKNLRNLVWDTTLSPTGFGTGKSGVTVEFRDKSFMVKTKRAVSNEFLDEITNSLHSRIVNQERKEIAQLKTCFNAMKKFSYPNVGYCMDDFDDTRSNELKLIIDDYFQKEEVIPSDDDTVQLDESVVNDVRGSVRQFLFVHGSDLGPKVTGRAIARIFHGIDSPRYPARSWGPARRFWRSKIQVDFNSIVKIATEELVKHR